MGFLSLVCCCAEDNVVRPLSNQGRISPQSQSVLSTPSGGDKAKKKTTKAEGWNRPARGEAAKRNAVAPSSPSKGVTKKLPSTPGAKVPSTSISPQKTVTKSPRPPRDTGMGEERRTMGRPLVATSRVTPAKTEVLHMPTPPSKPKRSPSVKKKRCEAMMGSHEEIHVPHPPSVPRTSPPSKEVRCTPTPSPPAPRKRYTSTPSPPEVRYTPNPSPPTPEARYTPTHSPPEVRYTPTRSPPEVRYTPTPSPPQVIYTPPPSPPEVRYTPTPSPSPPQVRYTPTPSPPEVRYTPPPSPPEVRYTPTPSPPEVRYTPTPSPPEVRYTPTPSPPEVRYTPTPSPPQVRYTPTPTTKVKRLPSVKSKGYANKMESSGETSRPLTPPPGSVPSSLENWEMTKKRQNRTWHVKGPKLSTILDQVPGLEVLDGSNTVLQPITESDQSLSTNGSLDSDDTIDAMISKLLVENKVQPPPPKKTLGSVCASQAALIPQMRPADIFPSDSGRTGEKKSLKNIHKLKPLSKEKNKLLSGSSKKDSSSAMMSEVKLGPLCGPLPPNKVPSPPLQRMEKFQRQKRLDEKLYKKFASNDRYSMEKFLTEKRSEEELYNQFASNDMYSIEKFLPERRSDEDLTANDTYSYNKPPQYKDADVNFGSSVCENFYAAPAFEYEEEEIWPLQNSRPGLCTKKVCKYEEEDIWPLQNSRPVPSAKKRSCKLPGRYFSAACNTRWLYFMILLVKDVVLFKTLECFSTKHMMSRHIVNVP